MSFIMLTLSFISPALGSLLILLFGKRALIRDFISIVSIVLAIVGTVLSWNTLFSSDEKHYFMDKCFTLMD